MSKSEAILVSKTERNLWNAIISEAMALLKYNAYALKALEEGHPEVAQIFQETAGAENIHGMTHMKTVGAIKSSVENLKSVTAGEAKEFTVLYPRMIKEALDDGRRDAARAFTMAMDRERHHLEGFMKTLELLELKLQQETETNVGDNQNSDTTLDSTNVSADTNPAESDQTREKGEPQQSPIETSFPKGLQEIQRERWRVAAFGRIREVIFGAQDGVLGTVALVTGVAVAMADTSMVLIAGLAAALAGMVSMASGAYLGSKAEKQVFQAEIEKEARELEENPAEEMAELVFLYHQQGMNYNEAREMAEYIASDKELWLRTLVEKELGIDPDLVSNPIKDGVAMGASYIIASLVPILPYFFIGGYLAIAISVGLGLTTLFVLGTAKGRVVQGTPLLQGLEILVIGVLVTSVGFLLGWVIPLVF